MPQHPFIFVAWILLASSAAQAAVVEYTNKAQWQAAAGVYSTITFTELQVNTLITTQYSHLGVTFTDGSDFTFFNVGFLNDGYGLNGALDETTVEFSQPMHLIATDFPGGVAFKLYHQGQLIYTSTYFNPSGVGHFAGLVSDQPFDKVYNYDPGGGLFIDDLYFGPPIPAPGAIGVPSALVLFGVRRMRTR